MEHLYREVGKTVRTAIASTPETARLCVITIVAALVITWFLLVAQAGG